MCLGTHTHLLLVLCSDPNDSSLCSLVHHTSGTLTPTFYSSLPLKKWTQPCANPSPQRVFPIPQSQHHSLSPQILKLSPLLTNLALGSLGGGGLNLDPSPCHGWLWEVVLGGCGTPLKGSPAVLPWAHSGFSLPSLFLCVLPPFCLCLCDAVVFPTHLPRPLSASPGVSASPCLSLP